jgi:hypothetical protein
MFVIEINGNSHDYKQKYDDNMALPFPRLFDEGIKRQGFSVFIGIIRIKWKC